jgi:predicted N-acetyltransferase YhbS
MDGPRGVRPEDLASLRALTDLVMREGLVDQYVQLFNEDNYENLRVSVDNGKCVCHVGMIERDAVLLGCRIQVGCIGGVCTHPDFRKRGLASACFDDALGKARKEGVDLMIVSGDRNLYRMRGCTHVGRDLVFTITPNSISDISDETTHPAGTAIPTTEALPHSITAEIMTPGELPLVTDCYRAEPVRFSRPPEDYQFALHSGWVMNRPSDFLVIREGGAFRGYVITPRTGKDGSATLAEFAGDRRSILAALPQILHRYGLTSLGFQVQWHDTLMRSLCEQAGLKGVPRSTAGTVTLINYPQLMERLRPYFVERLGATTASRLRFAQHEEQYLFALDEEELITDRANAARLLFGTLEGLPEPVQHRPGALGDALRALLPLPTLWYGLNYV